MVVFVAVMMVMSLTSRVYAEDETGSITINRDDSWDSSGEAKKATYTYYKVFDAIITEAADVDPESGELDGTGNVVYTVATKDIADEINKLNTLKAELASDGKYYVTKKGTPADAAILADIKTLVTSNSTLFSGTSVTSDANPVVIENLPFGYYYIEASNGKDVVIQTLGDVEINEKNDYPTVDKKQKKAEGSYADTTLPVEIGSYIDYQVTVHIPTDATKQIAVIDKMSAGLAYDSTTGLTLTPAVAYAALTSEDAGYDANATWQIKFASSVVEANRGNDIVITYRAKVTSDALTDTSKENEATLNYDNNNYVLKDEVNYETYFAGIYKVDPKDSSADMSGVKFELKDNNQNPVNVTFDSTNGYYVVDPTSSSNLVETHADGSNYTIKIRGLDNDKTYVLTEKEAKPGYNLLEGTVTLTKIKDEGTAFADKVANTYDRVENQKGVQLPSTGGIGTTIFHIAGAALVLGAGILLISKKRMNNN
jgi:fimbrial isopeptide formation D2 family protein/LPXTG-motif cell wall-anchored protein